jgi:hypothetical protein
VVVGASSVAAGAAVVSSTGAGVCSTAGAAGKKKKKTEMKNKYMLKYVELLIRVLGMVKEILPSDGVVSTGAEDILSEEKRLKKKVL